MDQTVAIRSAMVSRLPKFGARSSAGTSSPLSNGCLQAASPTPQEGKTTPPGTRPNGLIRNSSLSLKCRREGSTPTTPAGPADSAREDKTPPQLSTHGKEVKTACPGTPKVRRTGALLVAVSSPKAAKQAAKAEPKLSQSLLSGGPKVLQNGSGSPARPRSMSGSESRLARPRAGSGSGSPRSGSQDSLSRSSDGLRTLSLDSMVRSQSFTHFKQIPSPPSQPMTRSFSFNRAVERAQPLASTQLRPPGSGFLKPPQLSNGRAGPGGLGGLQYSRVSSPGTSISTTPTPTPGSLKKPLLPSCVQYAPAGGSGGTLGYRLARPGQAKQQKPLFTGRVKGDVRPAAAPDGLAGEVVSDVKADSHGGQCPLQEPFDQALEDQSLSLSLSSASASSLERGDTSEEFPDDLDSAGDALSDGDPADNRKANGGARSSIRCFLDETMDRTSKGLADPKEGVAVQESRGLVALSPEGNNSHLCSSLELSPSNSSGGTYMWDEEGLEPLGGAGMHPCDSYNDSDLNSMDLVNNLDPLGNIQLEDDDLMLDVDLPEDGSHDTEAMAHIDRSERAGRHGHWRRKQQRWNGQDHFHNDNRAPDFQHYDGLRGPGSFRVPPLALPSVGRDEGLSGVVDELTLKHMSQDCGSLRNQLLRLQTLLQLEDVGLQAEVFEESEDNITALQLEELRKEVRVLREELRSRDKTIAQLTLQCQELQRGPEQTPHGYKGRCQCQHQRATSAVRQGDRQGGRRVHQQYDKATQTYWRVHNQAPQVLQHSSPSLNEPFTQERLVKTRPTEAHSDPTRRGSGGGEAPAADTSRSGPLVPDLDKLNVLLGAHLHLLDRLGPGAPRGGAASDGESPAVRSGAAPDPGAPTETPREPSRPRSAGSLCPRMLQPPRLHRRLFIPVLPTGSNGSAAAPKPEVSPAPGAILPTMLPPPSRGLPCFNSGPQTRVPSPGLTLRHQPNIRYWRDPARGNTTTPHPVPEEAKAGQLRDSAAAAVLIRSSHSRLPKPKIH